MRRHVFDLVDQALGGRLADELRDRRAEGDSYADVAAWLLSAHGVRVSPETLRRWCLEFGLNAAADPEVAA
jgi:hypothetical protein